MSKIINEEINRMLYLFGYKPGKVISEQEFEVDDTEFELDEAGGRKKKVDVAQETQKIKDQIKDRVIKNGEIMISEFETLLKKDKPFLESLQPYYSKGLQQYKNVSPQDYESIYNQIVEKAKKQGDVTLQDNVFVSKHFPKKFDEYKSLLTYDSPFIDVSVSDKVQSIFNKANRTKQLPKEDRVYLSNHKPSVLRQLKPIVDKDRGRKKFMTDDILLDKLIEIEERVTNENNIRLRDYVYLSKNAPDVLEELKPIWGKKEVKKRLSDEELQQRFKEIEETTKRINDIYFNDYSFLKIKNPELLEQLRVYWGKYTKKPKPVVPEPIVEPETPNVGIGTRGRKPLTPEQIKKRIDDIKNEFSQNGRISNKNYQFLFKYDPDLLKTIVRPRKQKTKLDFEVSPEEIEYEPMGKLSDYWSSSSTGNFDYKYEN